MKTWILKALESARRLEKEGYEFYMNASKSTNNGGGKEMFRFLASEESRHYETVNNYIRTLGGNPLEMKDEEIAQSGFFSKAEGGRLWDKSDNLDALNISIQAEDRSIELYSKIHDQTEDLSLKLAMNTLIDEEKKHKSILEKETEFITETGEYHDFKTITS